MARHEPPRTRRRDDPGRHALSLGLATLCMLLAGAIMLWPGML